MIREFKPVRRLLIAMVMALLLLSFSSLTVVSAADATVVNDVIIKLDGKAIKISEPIHKQDGRLYVPVSTISELFGAKVSWDNENEELTIHTALKDVIILGNGVPVVYFNDERYVMEGAPFLTQGRLYAPLRYVLEMLHANVILNTEQNVVEVEKVQAATITEEYGLDEVSKQFGNSKSNLLKRNGLTGKDPLKAGMKLKVVVPSIYDNKAAPYTEADLMLLAKITMVESGHESYEGKLALANVIMNRVKSSSFPDSIKDVIYSGKQFPPAHNGLLDKSKPNQGSLRAAKDALNGKNNVEDAVYFFNPDVTRGSFWSNLEVIATFGNHSFAK